ncbi:PD-(D/E)XK motif protein [Clostridium sp.]|uniref:PD-(D/E)XK motif protein n=1 Tax=Clostridium sp. TaxID=1506 RepID=UPI001B62BC6C|nr:PD-(D/E)XK motif protein [Clostridium sp.]MBP3915276.1 PD-(D/E)XK motif protein [Clostridium sp.]
MYKKFIDKECSYDEGRVLWESRFNKIKESLKNQNRESASSRHCSFNGTAYKMILSNDGKIGISFIFDDIKKSVGFRDMYYEGITAKAEVKIDEGYEVYILSTNAENEEFSISFLYNLFLYIDDLKCSSEEKIKEIASYIKNIESMMRTQKDKYFQIEKEKALITEICSASFIYSVNKSWDKVLHYWLGPEKEIFDFDLENMSLETKVMNKKGKVTFHGTKQTTFTKDTFLHAFLLTEGESFTLESLIKKVTENMTRSQCTRFNLKLNQYGYYPGIKTSGKRYDIEKEIIIKMNEENFPKYSFNSAYETMEGAKLNIMELSEDVYISKDKLANEILKKG